MNERDVREAHRKHGTIKDTARELGVSYTTARSYLIKLGLVTPRERRYRLISMTGASPSQVEARIRELGFTPKFTDESVWPEVAAPRTVIMQLLPEFTIADAHLR